MKLKCPRCGKETESAGNPFRPFCSERCKTIDLGNWIQGSYRIPTRDADEQEDGAPAAPGDTDEP
jgi:hypothetical protein